MLGREQISSTGDIVNHRSHLKGCSCPRCRGRWQATSVWEYSFDDIGVYRDIPKKVCPTAGLHLRISGSETLQQPSTNANNGPKKKTSGTHKRSRSCGHPYFRHDIRLSPDYRELFPTISYDLSSELRGRGPTRNCKSTPDNNYLTPDYHREGRYCRSTQSRSSDRGFDNKHNYSSLHYCCDSILDRVVTMHKYQVLSVYRPKDEDEHDSELISGSGSQLSIQNEEANNGTPSPQ
ncbi:hypothetical protein TWF694_007146 [Orbilia ellipsospora]|uniref:Uncharacterized protein n=1 Tax=Orbilia ellipsospora TaxID=2528407 RepID=A0AAV9XK98_9PEZI